MATIKQPMSEKFVNQMFQLFQNPFLQLKIEELEEYEKSNNEVFYFSAYVSNDKIILCSERVLDEDMLRFYPEAQAFIGWTTEADLGATLRETLVIV